MIISQQHDFDKNSKEYYGHIIIENAKTTRWGTNSLIAQVRGITGDYKQIIDLHITECKIQGVAIRWLLIPVNLFSWQFVDKK